MNKYEWDPNGPNFGVGADYAIANSYQKGYSDGYAAAIADIAKMLANFDPKDIETDWIVYRELAVKKIKELSRGSR